MHLEDVERALGEVGLKARGGFAPGVADDVPEVAPAQAAKTVVLVGNAGPAMWERFAAERRAESDPLDRWTERVMAPVAERLGARAVYPFQRPFLAFQRWAVRAEECHPSPLRLLIHPNFGLWHGYRAALLFPFTVAVPESAGDRSPCDACEARPCLSTCPAAAFDGTDYHVDSCVAHLVAEPSGDCALEGCRARGACPIGAPFRYAPAQAEFHMAAFIRNHRRR